MADITLEQARAQLTKWIDADTNLSRGRSVAIDGQSVSLADTKEQIQFWQREVRRLEAEASGIRHPFHNHGLIRFS